MNHIWLASFPRSGNTFLRTILWHCFRLKSGSVYPNDLGGNKELEKYVGHIEQGPLGEISFDKNCIPLVKTHELPTDYNPAIYVVRDGRAACISLWHFYHESIPLSAVIEGQHRFGKWSDHVHAWNPHKRPNTLLLKYEEMRSDLPVTLKKISKFLKTKVHKNNVPDRATIASIDGRWVKNRTTWRTEFPQDLLDRFNEKNKVMLEEMGYW